MKKIAVFSCLLLAAAAACEDSKKDGDDKKKKDEASAKPVGKAPLTAAAGAPKAAKPGAAKPKVAAATAGGWTTYSNPKLGFTVETPRQPRVGKQRVNTEAGMVTAQTFTFSKPGANGMIAVWVTPMPFPKGHKPDPNKMFDGAVKNALRVINGKPSNEKNLTVEGVPGREVEASGAMKGRKVGAFFRMFYQSRTLYQVMAIYMSNNTAMINEAKKLIRSFKPVKGGAPKLASGTGQVEVSNLTIDAKKIGFGSKKGGYYLRTKFKVNVKQAIGARDKVRLHAWCKQGDALKAVQSQARPSDMKKVAGGGSVETRAAPFILKPLAQKPRVCQLSFKLATGLDDKADLGDFCWTSGKIAKGSCTK